MSDEARSSSLEDDKAEDIKDFSGATLQINQNNQEDGSTNVMQEKSGSENEEINEEPSPLSGASFGSSGTFNRNSQNRSSTIGRTSIQSTSSRVSMKRGVVKTDIAANSFYCYKGSQFDSAVEKCKLIIKPELDGDFKSSWLLTEIDHWDLEREKIILLTDYSMFVVKYNFINDRLYEYRRIMLHIINTIGVGDLKYPNSSLMSERKHGGIQLNWSKGQQITFGQRWNPWCTDIPWCTFTCHPLIYNPKENETVTYNVNEFFESLIPAISKAYLDKRPGETIKVIEGPVEIESYASPLSKIFNQSNLGFFKDRKAVSF